MKDKIIKFFRPFKVFERIFLNMYKWVIECFDPYSVGTTDWYWKLKYWLMPIHNIKSRWLDSNYWDYDAILEHTMFEILARHIESGRFDRAGWQTQDDLPYTKWNAKLYEILQWWKNEYLGHEDRIYDKYYPNGLQMMRFDNWLTMLNNPDLRTKEWKDQQIVSDKFHTELDQMRDTLTAKLKEIVDLREAMWD